MYTPETCVARRSTISCQGELFAPDSSFFFWSSWVISVQEYGFAPSLLSYRAKAVQRSPQESAKLCLGSLKKKDGHVIQM